MISVFRLKNGEDIIGQYFTDENENYDIKHPMSVDLDYRGNKASLVMNHWLPVQLVARNEAIISKQDILCVLDPSEDLEVYYKDTVDKLIQILETKNLATNMSDMEIEEAMKVMEEMVGNTIH
jgi:hypothetical protein